MRNKWILGAICAGVAVAMLLAVLSFQGGSGSNRKYTQYANLDAIPINGKVMGDQAAPVLVEVFSDYQCPWCARAAQGFEQEIIRNYVAKGTVRLQFRDYPIAGLESYWAAIAGSCAAQQGNFWKYHDKLFAEQKGENQGRFSQNNLKQWAKDLGLETTQFNRCLSQEESAPSVRTDYQLGQERKVNSTPTFFVNGLKLEGIPTARNFSNAIKKGLAGGRQ